MAVTELVEVQSEVQCVTSREDLSSRLIRREIVATFLFEKFENVPNYATARELADLALEHMTYIVCIEYVDSDVPIARRTLRSFVDVSYAGPFETQEAAQRCADDHRGRPGYTTRIAPLEEYV